MSLHIDFLDETNKLSDKEIQEIEGLLNLACKMEKVESDSELSVTFVNNEKIQEINREYREKDSVTDVISFALEEQGEGELEVIGDNIPRLLGDIIISIPKAQEQAESYNHSFMRELGFLTVHGFLHLLGYDHMTEEDEKEMFTRQKEILEEYGLSR
ncbi:rRNA maturation RNase YbeY [Pseudalkalibacillus caeni]|uniref:Endoribonuclease YbeY n=1 Tax=Exobacillus caeni TaxID=2574798 RepID=A0A5R9FER1_9BACL|nr:rRNA maturation RNase YbeY [Pseudalkalibacillus caeni]TLS39363.1 rRNA maturation RNase YbeY [Pseudalkalibacillus caeni]